MKQTRIFPGIITIMSFIILSTNYWYNTTVGFENYKNTKNAERSEATTVPNAQISTIISVGHPETMADMYWISLVQYIGNHLHGNSYVPYSQNLLRVITRLSPQFATAYEWALWILPIPQNSDLTYSEAQINNAKISLEIAEKGMEKICSEEKLTAIVSSPLDGKLWENNTLKNPCQSGMLSYLLGFYGGQLLKHPAYAKKYYTIAGMHDETPTVARILAVISSSDKNSPEKIAEKFAIMALGSYDEEPYNCYAIANTILTNLKNGLTTEEVRGLEKVQKTLTKPKPSGLPNSQYCYDMTDRALKYSYIAFVNTIYKQFGEKDITSLLSKAGLYEVPLSPSQSGMTMVLKSDRIWEYAQK